MENILTFELIKGIFNPIMGVMFFFAAYIGVDVVRLQDNIKISKAQVALLFAMPIAVVYLITGSPWEVVFATYAVTVAAYDLIVKQIKDKLIA